MSRWQDSGDVLGQSPTRLCRHDSAELAGWVVRRLWKIGVLANESWPPLEGLRHGLRDLGYVEGKTHLFVYRFAQGQTSRFPALAAELVNLPVDLIVSWGTPASLAAHRATSTIPVVMSAGDPVGAGIVSGLARPGGNVTGMSVQMAEQEGKRLELIGRSKLEQISNFNAATRKSLRRT